MANTPVVEKSLYTMLFHLIIGNYGQQQLPVSRDSDLPWQAKIHRNNDVFDELSVLNTAIV